MTHVVVLIRVGLAFQSPLRTRHPFRMIVLRHDDLRPASAFARLKAFELVRKREGGWENQNDLRMSRRGRTQRGADIGGMGKQWKRA